jgi:DNA-binding HxlR family transcriptional regulator
MPKAYGQACPVAKSLELVGDRWTLLLVRDLLREGPRRFADFHASLPGIPPNVLSQRLKLMEEHGLVTRRFYSEHPPRAEYTLTPSGQELGVVVGALASWGSRHVHRSAALVHTDCGHPVELKYFCAACAARVPGKTVTVARAPRGKGQAPRASRARVTAADGSRAVSRRTASGSRSGVS